MLAEVFQRHMQRRKVGSKRLANLVNEQFDLHLHRNTVENWRTGSVKRVRDWRPLVAIAVVLHLSTEEANQLLAAAAQPALSELRKLHGALPLLDFWHNQAPSTPDMSLNAPATYDFNSPLVTLTLANGTQFHLHGVQTFGIGRTDTAQNWQPAIKLEEHGGVAAGVSRKHGAIIILEQAVFIEDYASHNGTLLNGEKLTPHRRYPLSDGDHLLLSRLLVTVNIEVG